VGAFLADRIDIPLFFSVKKKSAGFARIFSFEFILVRVLVSFVFGSVKERILFWWIVWFWILGFDRNWGFDFLFLRSKVEFFFFFFI